MLTNPKRPRDFKKCHVKTYRELYEYLNENLKRFQAIRGGSFRDLMKRKFMYVYSVLKGELSLVHRVLLEIKSSGAFFTELLEAYAGEDVERLVYLVRRRMKQADIIRRNVVKEFDELGENDPSAVDVFKAGTGKLLSLYRRVNRKVLALKEYLRDISKMPDVRGDYSVVIVGLPQVGKSTLLSKLTVARPEIGTYPFTTKTIVVGHMFVEPYGRVVLIDSPGILDSPLEEKNLIEYKAILAIKHLADHVLYLFATYPGFYYTLAEQLNVYYMVKRVLGDRPITVLLSKVDLLDKEQMLRTINEIENSTGIRPIPISALTGFNLDKVREILVKHLTDRTRYR
ncbi:MAG: GTPase [Desulfurococcaceae archaeon]